LPAFEPCRLIYPYASQLASLPALSLPRELSIALAHSKPAKPCFARLKGFAFSSLAFSSQAKLNPCKQGQSAGWRAGQGLLNSSQQTLPSSLAGYKLLA